MSFSDLCSAQKLHMLHGVLYAILISMFGRRIENTSKYRNINGFEKLSGATEVRVLESTLCSYEISQASTIEWFRIRFWIYFVQPVSVWVFFVEKILFFDSYVIICVQKELSRIICFDSVWMRSSLFSPILIRGYFWFLSSLRQKIDNPYLFCRAAVPLPYF